MDTEEMHQQDKVPGRPNNEAAPASGDACRTGNQDPAASVPTVSSDASPSGGAALSSSRAGSTAAAIFIADENPGLPIMAAAPEERHPDLQACCSLHEDLGCEVPEGGSQATVGPPPKATGHTEHPAGTKSPWSSRRRKQPCRNQAAWAQKPSGRCLFTRLLPLSSPGSQPSSRRRSQASTLSQETEPGPARLSHASEARSASQGLITLPASALHRYASGPGPVLRCCTAPAGLAFPPFAIHLDPARLSPESAPGPARLSPESAPDATPLTEAVHLRQAPLAEAVHLRQAPLAEAVHLRQAPFAEAVHLRQAPLAEAVHLRQAPLAEEARHLRQAPLAEEARHLRQAPLAEEARHLRQAPLAEEAVHLRQAPLAEEAVHLRQAPLAEEARHLRQAPLREAGHLPQTLITAATLSVELLPGLALRGRTSGPSPPLQRRRDPPVRELRGRTARSTSARRSTSMTPGTGLRSRSTQRNSALLSRHSLSGPAVENPSRGAGSRRLAFQSSSGSPDLEVPSSPSPPVWHAVRMRASSPSPPGRCFLPIPPQWDESSSSSPSPSRSPGTSPSSSPTKISGQSSSSSSPEFLGLRSISTPSPASLRRALMPELYAPSPVPPEEQAEIESTAHPLPPPELTLGGQGGQIPRSRDQDHLGQHGETPSQLKNTKISGAWWCAPVAPATREAEAGESLEPGRRRLQVLYSHWKCMNPIPPQPCQQLMGADIKSLDILIDV
ncbi:LOW QUALITY PROTEIN: EZH inhibitory protein [Plecturocebus cupreus]